MAATCRNDVAGWQRNIGYIPQDIYLMDDTVRRNVAFGLPDHDIDDELVWKALRAAQIDNFICSLPGGLSAMTGERGERLSGGERQRLGIARALYRDPQVLVVDEATANLDNQTEAAIVHTLARLRGEKTIIVISHKLGMVKNCDCVYLLKQGRVRHSGVLSDLFSTDPAFREFSGRHALNLGDARQSGAADRAAYCFTADLRSSCPSGRESRRRCRRGRP